MCICLLLADEDAGIGWVEKDAGRSDTTGKPIDDLHQVSRLVMSFVIARSIGAVAGVIAALSKTGTEVDIRREIPGIWKRKDKWLI